MHEGYCRKYDQSLHPQRLFLYKINWLYIFFKPIIFAPKAWYFVEVTNFYNQKIIISMVTVNRLGILAVTKSRI